MIILGIETSCDETAISIIKATDGFSEPHLPLGNPKFEILSNVVSSQVEIHAEWGGVVPNLAKREHIKNLPLVLKQALREGDLLKKQESEIKNQEILNTLSVIFEREPELLENFIKLIKNTKTPNIDAIAVTIGPGLEPALWVGVNFARALSLVWDKPIIATNHMEGHIAAVLLPQDSENQKSEIRNQKINFPALALLVSGGHTELVLVKGWLEYEKIGQTRDDAVGEAFDKVARMLGLGYPGGPKVAALAAKTLTPKHYPLNTKIKLPRPMLHSKDYDFSFSGLKTAVLYLTKDIEKDSEKNLEKLTPEICAEFQQAVIDVLVAKTIRAAKEHKVKSVILGGGVAANKELRKQLGNQLLANSSQTKLFLPEIKFTGDNGAMIAAAAYFHALKKEFVKDPTSLKANGNLSL